MIRKIYNKTMIIFFFIVEREREREREVERDDLKGDIKKSIMGGEDFV